ncbi:MAG TPA: HAMP domain-containing protein, partial [Ferruginibacter sp.]|nr:HAMP domain-containing protein [Ferruginibacter sp.]
MNKEVPSETVNSRFTLRGLSIQQRLPLLICALLLCIILSFGFASYYSVRKSALETGRERTRSLTNNLGSMLSQSTANMIAAIKKNTANDTIHQYLAGGEKTAGITTILKKLFTDSTVVMVELLNAGAISIARYSESDQALEEKLSALWKTGPAADMNPAKVGKMYIINNSIYYPVVASIVNDKQVNGFLVSWRRLVTSPQTIEQISKLMGKGTMLYLSNTDGSLWTDLMKPVQHPPLTVKDPDEQQEYRNANGDPVLASVLPVAGSEWLVLVEYSKKEILESANRFLNWLLIIGGTLLITGILIARFMSHNITKPLKQLTTAAKAISKGDYTASVEIDRNDELGKLAQAFTIMKEQVQTTQMNLEKKVADRTAQLEAVNKELESFSYSVSHDLRAPLRGIIGFTTMLEEKYASQLDDEAKRLTDVIKRKTLLMGNLIDDLLGFSRVSRQDIVKHKIPTNDLVKVVIAGLGSSNEVDWQIENLPESWGDINA